MAEVLLRYGYYEEWEESIHHFFRIYGDAESHRFRVEESACNHPFGFYALGASTATLDFSESRNELCGSMEALHEAYSSFFDFVVKEKYGKILANRVDERSEPEALTLEELTALLTPCEDEGDASLCTATDESNKRYSDTMMRVRMELQQLTIPDAYAQHNNIHNAKDWAESCDYVLTINRNKQEIGLGDSKFGGLPHLPESLQWPEGYNFVAQLNMVELREYDRFDWLPTRGMVYFFLSAEGNKAKTLFADVEAATLSQRPYPHEVNQYIQRDLVDAEERLLFTKAFSFYPASGDELLAPLGAALEKALSAAFGEPVRHCDRPYGDRLFGMPFTFQGNDPHTMLGPAELLIQLEYGDGCLSFGLAYGALQKGLVRDARVCYEGT